MTLLAELYASPWAVRPEVLTAILGYVERHDVTPEMLSKAFHFDPTVQKAAQEARWNRYAVHQQTSVLVDGSQALYRRGTTAILPITGPIVRRGNLLASLSGGPMTSVEMLAKDFTRALESDEFTAILLDVDSPGGEAAGISELASIIRDGRDTKPITAYVGDLGASAAYWLASAASEIVINRTAALGSIGVVMAVPDPRADPDTHVEFVSSASPHKRPDPHSKDGKRQLQDLVDQLGDLFVDDVAESRAVSRDTVLEEFGQGGLRIGSDAVEHGLADRLGSFEEVLAGLAEGHTETRSASRPAPAPAPEPDEPADDAPLPMRLPDRQRSAVAAAVATQGGAVMPSLLDGLRQLVATAEAPASADCEAQLVTQHASDENATASAVNHSHSLTPHTMTAATTSAPVAMTDGDAALRQRLIAAEAENARLRFGVIQARAETFARARADELRVMPPEIPHLVALYCVLASDDETHGPLAVAQGKTTTRVAYLENLLAARQSRKELTEDVFGDTVAHVLTERTRAKVDPDAPLSPEQLAAVLEKSSSGRAALAQMAGRGV